MYDSDSDQEVVFKDAVVVQDGQVEDLDDTIPFVPDETHAPVVPTSNVFDIQAPSINTQTHTPATETQTHAPATETQTRAPVPATSTVTTETQKHRPNNESKGAYHMKDTPNDHDTHYLLQRLVKDSNKTCPPARDFPPYDGSDSWDDYFQQVIRIRTVNRWDENNAALYLSLALKGPALELVNASQRSRGGYPLSWVELVNLLSNTFKPVDDSPLLRSKLRSRRQLPHESVPQLHLAIRRDVARAYPDHSPAQQETIAVEIFQEAVNDSDIKLALLRAQPRSMDQALQCAERERIMLEGAYKRVPVNHAVAAATSGNNHNGGWGRPRNQGSSNSQKPSTIAQPQLDEIESIQSEISKLTARLEELKSKPSNQSQRGRGRGNGRHRRGRGACWSCSGFGHYEANCPNRTTNENSEN